MEPQSNQRGIETVEPHRLRQGLARPQSNQRGIETRKRPVRALLVPHRLNRTSVGLKQGPDGRPGGEGNLPQSNQRGIETLADRVGRLQKLRKPQSNQRGIETCATPWLMLADYLGLNRTSVGLKRFQKFQKSCHPPGASIEPAWD